MTGPRRDPAAAPDSATATEANRRVWPRFTAEELNITARLGSGGEILLVDLSRGGARLQSSRRMLPGSTLSLRLVTPDATFTITGRVVRSRIIQMPEGGLGYDLAVAFHEPLQEVQLPTGVEAPAPPPPAEPVEAQTESVDGQAEPVDTPPPTAGPASSPEPKSPVARRDPSAPLTREEIAANAAAVAEELGAEVSSDEWSDSVFHVTAMINDTGDHIRDLFEGNDW